MGRMRIEIALIVGIVFFCCWCIYIIIKMNSSVSLSSPQSANGYLIQPNLNPASPLSHIMSRPINGSYLMAQPQQQAGFLGNQQQQATIKHQLTASIQQPQRQQYSATTIGSLWPTASTDSAQMGHPRLPATNSAAPVDHIGGASTWRDYSSVTALQQLAGQQNRWLPHINYPHSQQHLYPMHGLAGQPSRQTQQPANFTPIKYVQQPHLMGGQYAQYHWRPVKGVGSTSANQQLAQINEQDLDPDPDSEHEASESQADQGDGGGGEQAADDDEPPTAAGATESPGEEEPANGLNRELEEQIGQRTFSEDEDESNERDKDGNLVVTHRKHLINGKPVRDNQRSARRRSRKQADFDQVVGEIEGDEQSDYDDAADGETRQRSSPAGSSSLQQADESRPRKSIQSVNTSPRIGNSSQSAHSKISTYANPSNADGKTVKVRNERRKVISNRKPKKGERELHEHRLHESLTAQQWDDDASSVPSDVNKTDAAKNSVNLTQPHLSSANRPHSAATDGVLPDQNAEEGAATEEEEEDSGKLEEDDDATGPQQVESELREMDMLVDPDRFMSSSTDDSDESRRKRRKRQVLEEPDRLPTGSKQLSVEGEQIAAADLISNFKTNSMENGGALEDLATKVSQNELSSEQKNSSEASNPKFGDEETTVNMGLHGSLRESNSRHSADLMKGSESKRAPEQNWLLHNGTTSNVAGDDNSGDKHRKYERGSWNDIGADFTELDPTAPGPEKQSPGNTSGSVEEPLRAPSEVDENAPVSALSDVSALPVETALGNGAERQEAIERPQNVASDEQPERASGAEPNEVVSGEEDDMSAGILASPPYLMPTQPPGPLDVPMANNGTGGAQYSDALQAPYWMSRPGRDLGRDAFYYGGPAQSQAPPDDERPPQTQSVESYPNRDTSVYYSSTGQGPPAPEVQAVDHQQDEPPLEAYHGVGPQMSAFQPDQQPELAYTSNGVAGSPFGSGMTDDNSNHLASASKVMKKKKMKKKKKFNKSMMSDSKLEKAKAVSMKKKSKYKKGGMKKKKKKAKNKTFKIDKEFMGTKKGKKGKKGEGEKGANKGNLYYKDKGYKKRGFKKAYKKLEEGDHKTYFDEFRDKDHNKKWKRFKDKHHYSQKKNWTGKDKKKFKNHQSNLLKDKKEKEGAWREKAASKHKKVHKYRGDSSRYSKKKKVKKESLKKKKDHF